MGRDIEQPTIVPSSTTPCRRLAWWSMVREELALAAERARLGEAWSLLRERVELCRQQDAAAQAERQEALRFAKETRDSVQREAQEVMDELDAAREALEEEIASKR